MSATYFTGKPCKRGHIAPRRNSTRACLACEKIINQAYRAVKPEIYRVASRQYRQRNPGWATACAKSYRARNLEKVKAARRIYCKNNRQKLRATFAAWRERNAERRRAYRRTYWLSYKVRNANKIAAIRRILRARRRAAMPSWADQQQISRIYERARLITASTNVVHHVDHIVPLCHPRVCGLHVPWNLQIITADENQKKNNRLIESLALAPHSAPALAMEAPA